jgi:hypothetical protein
MSGRRVAIGMGLALVLAGAALVACGGGHTARDTKVCQACTVHINQGCFDECQRLCLPDDPNCDTRCAAQCDQCRRDLVCGPCRADCTGTTLRCAPTNETVECDDGTYGGPITATTTAATSPTPLASAPP